MEKSVSKKNTGENISIQAVMRFLILSLIGIFLFFIPVKGTSVPLVVIIGWARKALGPHMLYNIVFWSAIGLNLSIFLGKVVKLEPFAKWHKNETMSQIILYLVALVSYICITLKVGSEEFIFLDKRIGGEVAHVSPLIFSTIFFAGWLIYFVLKSGIVEFTGTLIEPLMKPLFKLPGVAGIDALSSFVVSPAVGTQISEEYYKENVYTRKEAIGAATSFSTCSIGFVVVMASIGGVPEMSGVMTLCVVGVALLMTAIMMRIPPISKYEDVYFNGTTEMKAKEEVEGSLLKRAIVAGARKSEEFSIVEFIMNIKTAAKFAITIVTFMSAIVIITLTIVYHTDLFVWLGKPFEYIFALLGLPNADLISSAPVLTLPSLTLPVSAMAGLDIAPQSRFFVTLLSIVQILFMSEAGNAVMNSKMKVSLKDIMILFIVRTAIAIPIVAAISHILY
ncbi:MAG: transporter gate domain protein [Firmicutes bacterium]|jgi:nucleoside recognition membrane protein YjiH|nr:transporter gate domain protein [Bacillota bacterium]